MRSLLHSLIALAAIVALQALVPSLSAAEPLHRQIDALIAKAHPEGQAGLVDDADYLRRIYLALHGVIPSVDKAREFFADKTPDKRVKLVDELLADPQFARWMALSFDLMLIERRTEAHTKALPWREWLEESFKANKPWDALVREIVTADGANEKTRHIARWLLERQADPNALTKDVGRVFLGRDVSCSQCHDHPRIDDYLQRDYAGIQAFFARTYLFRPDNKKPGIVAEQATGETTYFSVFTKVGGDTGPRLPGGKDIIDPSKGEWLVAPDPKSKTVLPVPKMSRRALLGTALGDGQHPAFRRNIANRLWAIVFGRGLVEPLDLHHSANPPSNPALMDLLEERIAAMKFDMRAFIRELALTDAFQRSLDLPDAPPGIAQIKAMLPALEEKAATLKQAQAGLESQFRKDQKVLEDAQLVAEPTRMELVKLDAAAAAAQKAADDVAAPFNAATKLLQAKHDELTSLLTEEPKLNAEIAALAGRQATKEEVGPAVAVNADKKAASEKPGTEVPAPIKPELAKPSDAAKRSKPENPPPATKLTSKTSVKPAVAIGAKRNPEIELKTLKTRIATAGRAIAGMEKDIAAKKTAHEAKLKLLAAAKQAADMAREKMKGFSHGIDELQRAFVALEARKETGRIKARDAAALVVQLKTALAAADSRQKGSEAREALASVWSRSFAANELLPLTPEQLCWSALQATGQNDVFRKTSATQWDAKNKFKEADKADPKKMAERTAGIEVLVREKQRAFEAPFVTAFGGAAGQPQNDFFATPEQALYFENGGVLRSWAAAFASTIATKPDARAMAEELYLATLTRLPDEVEIKELSDMLAARPEKKADALADYTWALITSVEFRFSH